MTPELPPKIPARKYKKPPRKTATRDYGTRHQALRTQLLALYPICQYAFEGCTHWSSEADHRVVPARSVDDYTATCKSCHQKRHQHTT